jgi:Xaa-Pro aminopeptidase
VRARAERLADLLEGAGVELMLVSNAVNVRYLTGYTGSNGLALVGPRTRLFITDFRYIEQAAEEVDPSFERRRAARELEEALPDVLGAVELRLGFEDAHTSVRGLARLRELLPDSIELIGATGLVEQLRAVKDADELGSIGAAAELADTALEHVIADGLIGRTEREVAIALEHEMRQLGADLVAFPTLVGAGAHGALPHGQPREVEISRGDLVVIDWGAELDGYRSDCTRTVAAGEPHADARAVYELVLEAQLAGLGALRAGAGGREVDSVVRSVIDAGGYGDQFGHGLGHGVGLEIHEAPRLSQRSTDDLVAGNVVTVEPGIYLPGRFGVRIEDLVAVTDGGADVLTSVDKQLIVTD